MNARQAGALRRPYNVAFRVFCRVNPSNPGSRRFMTTALARREQDLGDVLALAFGITVGMWAIGYISRVAGLPNWLLFFALLAAMLFGGFVAGRSMVRGLRGLVAVGVIVGLLNLLILGSVLSREETRALGPAAAWAVPGWIILCALLVCGGARLGRILARPAGQVALEAMPAELHQPLRYAPLARDSSPWPARFAAVALAATTLLLVAGGIVTGFEVGMAVPDWPSTFGYNMFLYPLAHMSGGIYFEHSHRLLGSLVGLTTLVLAMYLQVVDRRPAVRIYGFLLLGAVILQGVLGGLRVTQNDVLKAAIHGVLAQLFFVGMVVLVAVLSPAWRREPRNERAAGFDVAMGWVIAALLLLQIVLGARLRHFFLDLHLHIGLGVLAAALGSAYGLRAWLLYESRQPIARLGGWLVAALGLQVLLGIGAFLAVGDNSASAGRSPLAWEVAITTVHQTTGAVVLGLSVAVTLWQRRLGLPESAAAGQPAARRQEQEVAV